MSNLQKRDNQCLVQIVETMYSRLPDDLQGRMVQAVDSMLGIGDNDTGRGQTITNWSQEAVNLYRLMGVDEAEIREKVGQRVESFLETGRSHGLSSGINGLPFLNGGDVSESTAIVTGDFQTRYNLDHFRNIKSLLGSFQSISYYDISLQEAFGLAAEIGDEGKAREACLHMIRLGKFDAAYKTAERLGDDRTLVNLGKLALVDFFDQYSPYGIHNATNRLWDAVESLKRVQGESKPIAAEMLYDLATEISSEGFIQGYVMTARTDDPGAVRDTILHYSLKALRSTGTLVERQPIDSVKVDFITRVEDGKYATAIRDLAHRVMETADRPDLDEVRKSLQAIGDTESLNAYAEELFEQRHDPQGYNPIMFYSQAIEFFKAAGNNDSVRRVIDATMTEGILDLDDGDYEFTLVPAMAEIGYTEGLNRVKALTSTAIVKYEEGDHHRYSWQRVAEKTEKALAGQSLREVDEIEASVPKDESLPDYVHKAQVEERRYTQSLEESRAKLTPESRRELIAQGTELLEQGDAWNAYICFKDSLHRQGLIQAGDMMLKQGDGLNARTPYMFASLLPQEDLSLPGGVETKLIEG